LKSSGRGVKKALDGIRIPRRDKKQKKSKKIQMKEKMA